ncbi:MAG TPA: preprotein translocase subunit SecG [Elusimicrobiales bacterium]|nr:preprotein translocase subunit SecG [Elusimicrobiales bacterium]
MYTMITVLHVILAFLLIIVIVVFQSSKGSALAMFGGGGDALFSSGSGTTFIKKFTMWLAVAFAATSIMLTVFSNAERRRSVVFENPMGQPQQAAPAKPAPAQPAPAPAGK